MLAMLHKDAGFFSVMEYFGHRRALHVHNLFYVGKLHGILKRHFINGMNKILCMDQLLTAFCCSFSKI